MNTLRKSIPDFQLIAPIAVGCLTKKRCELSILLKNLVISQSQPGSFSVF